MDRHEIRCVQKSHRTELHNKIEFIGGLNSNGTHWKITIARAIHGIESGKWTFFVKVESNEVDVIIASNNGNKYLKTLNDNIEPNNLLSLPPCP